jgi:hypothetical protein
MAEYKANLRVAVPKLHLSGRVPSANKQTVLQDQEKKRYKGVEDARNVGDE